MMDDLTCDPTLQHSRGGCRCEGDGSFAFGLSLLFEELNEPCICETDYAKHECRSFPLLRWWRGTDRPWTSRPRRVGGMESEIGAQGMAVVNRLLNGKARHARSTITKELSLLRRSIRATQGVQCAACRFGIAKYLCKNPRPGVSIGAICSACVRIGGFDTITFERLVNGEIDGALAS